MKSNAIARIVIFSMVIVVLLCALVFGLGVRCLSFNVRLPRPLEEGTLASQGSVPAGEINTIDIQWVSGSIDVVPGDTDEIRFQEDGGIQEKYKMVWSTDGTTLRIRFCQEQEAVSVFHSPPAKHLTVTVPREWEGKRLSIDSVSAHITVEALKAEKVTLNNVSGVCDFTDCSIGALRCETVSGDLRYSGSLEALDCDAVSAQCRAALSNTPREISMEGVSGNLELTLPQDTGFTASLDSLSGKITCQFPATVNGNTYTYGDGRCQITASGISGSILLNPTP